MNQKKLAYTILLSVLAMPSFAQIAKEDFRFPEEGELIVMDGTRGAPLHIEYVGTHLPSELKVKVTPDTPDLKLTHSTCTFTSTVNTCRLQLHLAHPIAKVYGIHTFTVTDAGGAVSSTGSGDTALPVTFSSGISSFQKPKPIQWVSTNFYKTHSYPSSPIVLVNATQGERLYGGESFYTWCPSGKWYIPDTAEYAKNHPIRLPAKTMCYADLSLVSIPKCNDGGMWYQPLTSNSGDTGDDKSDSPFTDVTDPNHKIFNAPVGTGNNNLTTCSALGVEQCASGLWGSMSMGLANIGGTDKTSGNDRIKSGEVQVISDTSWGNASFSNPGSIIYWEVDWHSSSMALLQIQGTTDGSSFDVKQAAPTALEIKSAPPCSSFYH